MTELLPTLRSYAGMADRSMNVAQLPLDILELAIADVARLQSENKRLRDVLEWSENNCPGECKGAFDYALTGEIGAKMFNPKDKLELHMGEDYAVAMLPRDTTENAAIMFGCNTEDDFCEEVITRYNSQPELMRQLERANRIIGWMSPSIGNMCPPEDGIFDFNEHCCENRIPDLTKQIKGSPLKQRRYSRFDETADNDGRIFNPDQK